MLPLQCFRNALNLSQITSFHRVRNFCHVHNIWHRIILCLHTTFQILHSMNRASWYTYVRKTNKIHSFFDNLFHLIYPRRRSQWPRGLRHRCTAARLLRSWVRIAPRAWMFVCCECCVLSGRGLCDGLIIRSEESYGLWRVVVCDHETSQARRLKPARGL